MKQKTVVLVLRSPDTFSAKLIEIGCEVINLELLRVEPVESIDVSREDLGDLDGLFFTSPHAAKALLPLLKDPASTFEGNIYVLGERAKDLFENARIRVLYQKDANTAAQMIALFGKDEFAGKRLLYVRGDRSMRTIPDLLGNVADIREQVVYRTIEVAPDGAVISNLKERLGKDEIDWMCFFSPSGVEALINVIDTSNLRGVKTAAIGETTAAAIRLAGLDVSLISKRSQAEHFADELIEQINNFA